MNYPLTFDQWHPKQLPRKQFGEDFWQKVLKEFIEVDYTQKLEFFKSNGLQYDVKYFPEVPEAVLMYNEVDVPVLENKLRAMGQGVLNPPNDRLIKFYCSMGDNHFNNINSIAEIRDLLLFNIRFALDVLPTKKDDEAKIILFNKYLESHMLESLPQFSAKHSYNIYINAKVRKRKPQIETLLEKIRIQAQNIGNLRDSYEYFEFEDGYSGYKSYGMDYVPKRRKITLDFLAGKNNAEFEELLRDDLDELNPNTLPLKPRLKIKWIGQKNQLYNVLRQLKNEHELIANSYNELVDFIIENVTGFEDTKKETIEKELKKKSSLPKPKRITVDPNKK